MSHSAEKDAGPGPPFLPPLHHGYKARGDYDGPWPPAPPKGPGGGSRPPVVCADCGWEFADRAQYDAHLSDPSFIHTRIIPPGKGQ